MKPNIQEIDQNFKTAEVNAEKLVWRDVRKEPLFSLHGLYQPLTEGLFRRIPEEVAKATNDGVAYLHTNTSGGRVRFRTDSAEIAVRVKFPYAETIATMSVSGIVGCDLYADGKHVSVFAPPMVYENYRGSFDIAGEYEAVILLEDRRMREITVFFPLYNNVESLEIGLEPTAAVEAPRPYRVSRPIVFYGSSITQGAVASRPGNAYPAILSRKLDADFLNLGFSGNARGEEAIARYIAQLDMSAFVFDYDHNAPDPEHLKKTHEPMFRLIRERHPDLPIIMMTCPGRGYPEEERARRAAIVSETYCHAIEAGDRNVSFVDGRLLPQMDPELMLVDASHPNDFGFFCMASALEPILRRALR